MRSTPYPGPELEALRRERDDLDAACHRLQMSVTTLSAQLQQQQGLTLYAQEERDRLREESEALRSQIRHLESTRTEASEAAFKAEQRVATLEAEQADAQGAIEGLERQNQQLGLQLQQLRDQHGEERCCSRSTWQHLQGVNTNVRLKMERLDFVLRNLPRYCAGRDGAMGADDGDLLDRAEVIAACDEACKDEPLSDVYVVLKSEEPATPDAPTIA